MILFFSHLNNIGEDFHGSQSDSHSLDGIHEGLDEMRRRLEDVGPDEVHEMREGVLTPEAEHAERHVLDGGAGRLTMNQISEKKG